MRRTLSAATAVLALAGLGACSSDDAAPSTSAAGCTSADGGRVVLVAEDLAWDADCLEAPAGDLVIEVDNRDDGVNHNVHLPDAPGSPATELVAGPTTDELAVTLEAGSYEYICDIHPNMVGTLTVT